MNQSINEKEMLKKFSQLNYDVLAARGVVLSKKDADIMSANKIIRLTFRVGYPLR